MSSRNYLGDGDDSLDDSMIEKMYAAAAAAGGAKAKKKNGTSKVVAKKRPVTAVNKPPAKITAVGKQAKSRLFDYKSEHEMKAKTL